MTPLEVLWMTAHWAAISFGGFVPILPEMTRELIETRQVLTAQQFGDGYALGQVVPGPNYLATAFFGFAATQSWQGALAAIVGTFFTSWTLAVVAASAWRAFGTHPWSNATRNALLAIGAGMLVGGALGLTTRTLHAPLEGAVALGSFLLVFTNRVRNVVLVLVAGVVGAVLGHFGLL